MACLNLHASLLPKYRGAAPIQAAIVQGDRETGITVMYMDEGLDTGDVLLESRIAIAADETGGSLHDRLGEVAPAALAEALAKLASRNAPRVPQNNAEATHAPKLEREHGRINWSESAEVIERKIRAFNPWPGSYTILRGAEGDERKVKIFSAGVTEACGLASGEVSASESGGLLIGASDGALALEEVQLEGKKAHGRRRFNPRSSLDCVRVGPDCVGGITGKQSIVRVRCSDACSRAAQSDEGVLLHFPSQACTLLFHLAGHAKRISRPRVSPRCDQAQR